MLPFFATLDYANMSCANPKVGCNFFVWSSIGPYKRNLFRRQLGSSHFATSPNAFWMHAQAVIFSRPKEPVFLRMSDVGFFSDVFQIAGTIVRFHFGQVVRVLRVLMIYFISLRRRPQESAGDKNMNRL